MSANHTTDIQSSASIASTDENHPTAKPPTAIKLAWQEAEAIYLQIRSTPNDSKDRGKFTDALFRTRVEFGGKSLLEATARIIVHRQIRKPQPRHDKRRGTETWLQYHYDLARVETDVTEQVTRERLTKKILTGGSATQFLSNHDYDPNRLTKRGRKPAHLETYLSTIIRNAVIDYLRANESCVESDPFSSSHRKNVGAYDDEDTKYDALDYEDFTMFADMTLDDCAADFARTLPNETLRAVLTTYLVQQHTLEETAKILGIPIKTCARHVDNIENRWANYEHGYRTHNDDKQTG